MMFNITIKKQTPLPVLKYGTRFQEIDISNLSKHTKMIKIQIWHYYAASNIFKLPSLAELL